MHHGGVFMYPARVTPFFFFFSSRRRHTRSLCDWSSDVCSSDLMEALDAWAEILLRAPATVLLMGNSTSLYAQKVRQRMGCKGVSSDRLIFVERLSLQGYLALHQRIDLMLDTFPYNGGTTTLHAIGM